MGCQAAVNAEMEVVADLLPCSLGREPAPISSPAQRDLAKAICATAVRFGSDCSQVFGYSFRAGCRSRQPHAQCSILRWDDAKLADSPCLSSTRVSPDGVGAALDVVAQLDAQLHTMLRELFEVKPAYFPSPRAMLGLAAGPARSSFCKDSRDKTD